MSVTVADFIFDLIGDPVKAGRDRDRLLGCAVDELGIDSLELMELLMEIEDHYHVEISEDLITAETTLNDLIGFVEAQSGVSDS